MIKTKDSCLQYVVHNWVLKQTSAWSDAHLFFFSIFIDQFKIDQVF